MKVLLTGFNPMQAAGRSMTRFVSAVGLYKQALLDGGHEVTHRPLEPDDDLTGFDVVLLGVSPPKSIGARYKLPALAMYPQLLEQRVPTLMYIDDWKTTRIRTEGEAVLKTRDTRQFVGYPGKALHDTFYRIEWGRANYDRVIAGLEVLLSAPWPPLLVCAYAWGDHALLVRDLPQVDPAQIIAVDPSAYTPAYPVQRVPDDQRARAWVLGALTTPQQWLKQTDLQLSALGWPVHHYGGKYAGGTRLQEPDLVQEYARHWGVLSLPYDHVGSGWWRTRHQFAVQTGAVLASDPRELGALGAAFTHSASAIEAMTAAELRTLADEQAHAWCGAPTRDDVQWQLTRALYAAAEWALR